MRPALRFCCGAIREGQARPQGILHDFGESIVRLALAEQELLADVFHANGSHVPEPNFRMVRSGTKPVTRCGRRGSKIEDRPRAAAGGVSLSIFDPRSSIFGVFNRLPLLKPLCTRSGLKCGPKEIARLCGNTTVRLPARGPKPPAMLPEASHGERPREQDPAEPFQHADQRIQRIEQPPPGWNDGVGLIDHRAGEGADLQQKGNANRCRGTARSRPRPTTRRQGDDQCEQQHARREQDCPGRNLRDAGLPDATAETTRAAETIDTGLV